MPCRKIVKETVDKFGQLDVLVNNASFQGKDVEKFEDITRERLEFTFHSNILAYFTVAQAAVPHMPKGSAIININSIQGYQPSFGVLDYACTKVLHDCILHLSLGSLCSKWGVDDAEHVSGCCLGVDAVEYQACMGISININLCLRLAVRLLLSLIGPRYR